MMGPPYPGVWTFKYHPWLRQMHDDRSPLVIGQKSAQMGYTEWALNVTFYTIDVEGKNVLYVLPNTQPDARDFSNARFSPALDLSPKLKQVFTDVNNVGHKRAGNANLYVRGSRSKAGLRSIPVQKIILDEVDVMEQVNLPLAMERVSGQPDKQVLALSTPTIQDYGINALYSGTTQSLFHFPCPSCSRYINLEFPRNIEITGDDPNSIELRGTYYKCHLCNAVLPQAAKPEFLGKGVWIESKKSEAKGYHVNQMYSSPIQPYELAAKYLRGLNSQADEQEFYNSALGLPHSVAGARVTDEMIANCMGEYFCQTDTRGTSFITMGVDVGNNLHVELCDWKIINNLPGADDINTRSVCKVIAIYKLKHFEELDQLMLQYNVQKCVLDLNPERRKVQEFCARWYGRAEGCEYPLSTSTRSVVANEAESTIQVDRTAWLDMSLGRFRNGTIKIPKDVSFEYREHIKAQTRVYYRDREGNVKAKFVTAKTEDHFGHARNYAEIAYNRAVVLGGGQARHPWQ